MADIFLSYSHKDFAPVRRLVEALEQKFWTVFWDRRLEVGGEWSRVLEREVAQACCVVVAWSPSSVGSSWVRKEAELGKLQNKLIPICLADVAPAPGFEHLHTASLTNWDGTADSDNWQSVVAAIRKKCGLRGDVTIEPTRLYIVIGDREVYQGVGPILNVDLTFANASNRPAVVKRLDLEVHGPEDRAYDLRWHLFYGTEGMQQRKIDASARVEVASGATMDQGVQFQGPLFSSAELWPAGEYALDLYGWTQERTALEQPNLVTRFRAVLEPGNASWVRHWQLADSSAFDPPITNRAVGIPVPIRAIELGR